MTLPILSKFQDGFRLINGTHLNKLVAAINSVNGNGQPSLANGLANPVFSTIPLGSVAYGSLGTDTTMVAGTLLIGSIYIPQNMTVTNINVLQGTIAGTDKLIGALYNSAGTLLANSATAGVTVTTSNTFLVLPLTTALAIAGPGLYFVAVQSNGTTDKVRTVAASTYVGVLSKSQTGVFATLPNITPPTTFAANTAPAAYLN